MRTDLEEWDLKVRALADALLQDTVLTVEDDRAVATVHCSDNKRSTHTYVSTRFYPTKQAASRMLALPRCAFTSHDAANRQTASE